MFFVAEFTTLFADYQIFIFTFVFHFCNLRQLCIHRAMLLAFSMDGSPGFNTTEITKDNFLKYLYSTEEDVIMAVGFIYETITKLHLQNILRVILKMKMNQEITYFADPENNEPDYNYLCVPGLYCEKIVNKMANMHKTTNMDLLCRESVHDALQGAQADLTNFSTRDFNNQASIFGSEFSDELSQPQGTATIAKEAVILRPKQLIVHMSLFDHLRSGGPQGNEQFKQIIKEAFEHEFMTKKNCLLTISKENKDNIQMFDMVPLEPNASSPRVVAVVDKKQEVICMDRDHWAMIQHLKRVKPIIAAKGFQNLNRYAQCFRWREYAKEKNSNAIHDTEFIANYKRKYKVEPIYPAAYIQTQLAEEVGYTTVLREAPTSFNRDEDFCFLPYTNSISSSSSSSSSTSSSSTSSSSASSSSTSSNSTSSNSSSSDSSHRKRKPVQLSEASEKRVRPNTRNDNFDQGGGNSNYNNSSSSSSSSSSNRMSDESEETNSKRKRGAAQGVYGFNPSRSNDDY